MSLTLNKLINSTEEFNKGRVTSTPDIQFSNIDLTPYFGLNTLLVNGKAISSEKNKHYTCLILFDEVDYKDSGKIKLTAGTKIMYIDNIDKTLRVQVHCSCMDHYFTFAWWNKQQGSHYGKEPRPYQRKTDTRPERNPEHIPGMCKHLLNLVSVLKDNKILI